LGRRGFRILIADLVGGFWSVESRGAIYTGHMAGEAAAFMKKEPPEYSCITFAAPFDTRHICSPELHGKKELWVAHTGSYGGLCRKYTCEIRTATWLSHGDSNDEQQLGRGPAARDGSGTAGRAVFGVWLVRRGTDGWRARDRRPAPSVDRHSRGRGDRCACRKADKFIVAGRPFSTNQELVHSLE
jgi:hypothetical protein